MPRKHRDPIETVMEYFETAPIDAAHTALHVAGNILRRRDGATTPHTPPAAVPRKPAPRAARPLPPPAPSTVGD